VYYHIYLKHSEDGCTRNWECWVFLAYFLADGCLFASYCTSYEVYKTDSRP
jgi:hypothetical protein